MSDRRDKSPCCGAEIEGFWKHVHTKARYFVIGENRERIDTPRVSFCSRCSECKRFVSDKRHRPVNAVDAGDTGKEG